MLRPIAITDASFLCSIFIDNPEYYNIFFESETDISEWEKRIDSFSKHTDIHHFVIEDNGTDAGWFSYIDISSTERELGILVVAREFLHLGIGTRVLKQFISQCRSDGIKIISLNVNQNNLRAVSFYKQFGFEIYGEEIIPQCNDAVNVAQYKMKLNITA